MSDSSEAPRKVSKSQKSGLTFPVGRLRTKLRKGNYADRIGDGAAIFIAAVLEYLAAELVEIAGDIAQKNQKQRINPRHVMLAIKSDPELDQLLQNVTISGSGVVPHVNPVLLTEKSKRKKNNNLPVPSQEF